MYSDIPRYLLGCPKDGEKVKRIKYLDLGLGTDSLYRRLCPRSAVHITSVDNLAGEEATKPHCVIRVHTRRLSSHRSCIVCAFSAVVTFLWHCLLSVVPFWSLTTWRDVPSTKWYLAWCWYLIFSAGFSSWCSKKLSPEPGGLQRTISKDKTGQPLFQSRVSWKSSIVVATGLVIPCTCLSSGLFKI